MVVDVTIRVRIETQYDLDDGTLAVLEEGIAATEVASDIRSAVGRVVSRQFRRNLDSFSVGAVEVHCTQKAPRA